MTEIQYEVIVNLLSDINCSLQLHPIVPARMPEKSDVERSGNPSVPGDSPGLELRTWSWDKLFNYYQAIADELRRRSN